MAQDKCSVHATGIGAQSMTPGQGSVYDSGIRAQSVTQNWGSTCDTRIRVESGIGIQLSLFLGQKLL